MADAVGERPGRGVFCGAAIGAAREAQRGDQVTQLPTGEEVLDRGRLGLGPPCDELDEPLVAVLQLLLDPRFVAGCQCVYLQQQQVAVTDTHVVGINPPLGRGPRDQAPSPVLPDARDDHDAADGRCAGLATRSPSRAS